MSKKTHKKASKPKVGPKAKASAKKAVGAAAKVRTKAKAASPTAGARKARTTKSGSKRASSPAKSNRTKRVTKTASKPAVAIRTRTSSPKTLKPSSAKPARADVAPEHASAGLTIGSKVPAFRLPRDGGATVSLDSFTGRKLVIFFYPRASTPGCTKEAMDFSRLSGAFAALDADVVGISADPQHAQETFRDKHDLTVPLLSDEAHAVLNAFGVWGDKSLYGKIFQGIIRTTVLLGPDARVINIWRNVKVDGHAEAVLNYIENL
ncbi:MAG: redoxin domain-containing protein [Xanthobacteraceae bacterium]